MGARDVGPDEGKQVTTPSTRPLPRRVSSGGRLGVGALAVLLALVVVGCTGVQPPVYCYQVAAATIHGVDTGMSVAGDLYREGVLSEGAKAQLVAAHNVYRPAAQSAVAACKVVGSQGDADKILVQLQVAADRLYTALVAAGVLK